MLAWMTDPQGVIENSLQITLGLEDVASSNRVQSAANKRSLRNPQLCVVIILLIFVYNK